MFSIHHISKLKIGIKMTLCAQYGKNTYDVLDTASSNEYESVALKRPYHKKFLFGQELQLSSFGSKPLNTLKQIASSILDIFIHISLKLGKALTFNS